MELAARRFSIARMRQTGGKMTTEAKDSAASGAVDRGTELSEQVFDEIRDGQEQAIEAVRKFMRSVDEALPHDGEGPSRRQDIVDSALEMSEKLVKTQYEFLTKVVRSAGDALGASGRGE
jgi:hypothetical protein